MPLNYHQLFLYILSLIVIGLFAHKITINNLPKNLLNPSTFYYTDNHNNFSDCYTGLR